MASVGELIGKEAVEALSKGVKNSRKAVSKEATKTLNKTAKKAVESSNEIGKEIKAAMKKSNDDIAKEINSIRKERAVNGIRDEGLKDLRERVYNARKTEQEFYNKRAGHGNKAKTRMEDIKLMKSGGSSDEVKAAFEREEKRSKRRQKYAENFESNMNKGSNIKDKIDDIKENPTKNSAKKVNAGAEESPLKNTLHKAMPMAVGGAIVFGLWNSRGQQSNAQLYGQAPMPGQGGY